MARPFRLRSTKGGSTLRGTRTGTDRLRGVINLPAQIDTDPKAVSGVLTIVQIGAIPLSIVLSSGKLLDIKLETKESK